MPLAPQDNYILPLPQSVGERVGVRGYLLRYAHWGVSASVCSLFTPHLNPLPSRGEEIFWGVK
jgi:hypothetical protein